MPRGPRRDSEDADVAFMAPARALGLHFPDKPTVIDVLITETGRPFAVQVIDPAAAAGSTIGLNALR